MPAPHLLLIDTSAWIEHMRRQDPVVVAALQERMALGHLDVAGELRVGSGVLATRLSDQVLGLPRLPAVDPIEAMATLDDLRLQGRGIGWTDVSIIVACMARGRGVALYTRDRRMAAAARDVGLSVLSAPE